MRLCLRYISESKSIPSVSYSNRCNLLIQYGMKMFDGKRFFVYGDGISGRAARQAIKRQGGKAKIYSDVNGKFSPPPIAEYDGAIISPGIRPTHAVYDYCAKHGIPTLGEVDIGFALAEKRQIVGVTGTNGKTTVTRLIAEMSGGVACGNIGYPISTAVFSGGGPLVCELSSFQLHGAAVSPSIAVITNIASDHIDWHGDIESYYASKCKIASAMCGGYLVLGEDIPVCALKTLRTGANILYCSTKGVCDGAYVQSGYFCFSGKRVCPTDYLRLTGEHNIKNALCAIAVAKCLGADNGKILDALSSVSPSPHRTEYVGEACGKRWIDDSKGTNISACLAAIACTEGSVCLIVGGRGKAENFCDLFKSLDGRVKEVIAMGETAQDIRDSALKTASPAKVIVVNGLYDAVRAAAECSAKTVLLSPACASFDEFKDYAQRGEKFKSEVRMLARRGESRC